MGRRGQVEETFWGGFCRKRGQHFLHVPVWSSMAISADPSSPSCLNDIRAVRCSPLAAINSSREAYGRIYTSVRLSSQLRSRQGGRETFALLSRHEQNSILCDGDSTPILSGKGSTPKW
jgi:hypothetical protein